MPKYLVTGGCGFIGSHLTSSLLEAGHTVCVLDDLSTGRRHNVANDCEVIVGSVTDTRLVNTLMEGVDGCFHLAAISSVQKAADSWPEASAVNVIGTINVFDAAANSADRTIPVVYASSCAVYGNHRNAAHAESDPPQPINSYGIDKYCGELYARFAARAKGIRSFGLRLFNVYGPRQDPSSPYSGVISIFVDRLLQGKELPIYGDGKQARDFVYVEDVVSFFLCALEHADRNSEVVNVCRGAKIQICNLAHTLSEILGQRPTFNYLPKRPGDVELSFGDPSHASALLDMQATTALEQGLRKTVQHWREGR